MCVARRHGASPLLDAHQVLRAFDVEEGALSGVAPATDERTFLLVATLPGPSSSARRAARRRRTTTTATCASRSASSGTPRAVCKQLAASLTTRTTARTTAPIAAPAMTIALMPPPELLGAEPPVLSGGKRP
jgi:hypothetical protein